MQLLLFPDWWISLGVQKQIFWSLSIVFGLLLAIFSVLHIFDSEEPLKNEAKTAKGPGPWTILLFLTFFNWAGLLLTYQKIALPFLLLIASIISAGMLGIPRIVSLIYQKKTLTKSEVLKSLGEVSQSIPPHQNGTGKVHLKIRRAPFELNAVTTGSELPAGSPIRVVDIVDENTLLVEPVETLPQARNRGPRR